MRTEGAYGRPPPAGGGDLCANRSAHANGGVQPCWRLPILQQLRRNPGQFSTRTDLVAGHGAGVDVIAHSSTNPGQFVPPVTVAIAGGAGDGAFCLPQRAGASLAFDGAVRLFSH